MSPRPALAALSALFLLTGCPPEILPGQDEGSNPHPTMGYRSVMNQDGSDFSCDWEEESCVAVCDEEGSAPVLGVADLLVDGVPGRTPEVGRRLHVRVPFHDLDCDLGCGSAAFFWRSASATEESEASTCSNMPCDTTTTNVYTGFDLGIAEAGDYAVRVRLADRCGRYSEPATLEFTVGE